MLEPQPKNGDSSARLSNGQAGPENAEQVIRALPAIPEFGNLHLTETSCLADLPVYAFQVDAQSLVSEIEKFLREYDILPGVIITENQQAIGVISRRKFYEKLGQLYGISIYLRRSVALMLKDMDATPLLLSATTSIPEALYLALSRPVGFVYEPIIVEFENRIYRLLDIYTLLMAQSKLFANLQQELQTANDELEQRVEARTAELVEVNRDLTGEITKRKHVEAGLRESEQRLRIIFDASPIPMLVTRLSDGTIQYGNEPLSEIAGTPLTELIGANAPDFYYHPDERKTVLAQLEQNGAVHNYEVQLKRADDEPFWAILNLEQITFDGDPAILGAIYDITQRKEAEAGLQLQQLRLRSLYDISTLEGLEVSQQFEAALQTGAHLLNLEIGLISQVDGDVYKILYAFVLSYGPERGQILDLKHTYCDLTLEINKVISIDHVGGSEYKTHPCYENFGMEAYIGIPLWVKGKKFGTLSFSSVSPREPNFNETDHDFVRLMGEWVSTTLEREQDRIALTQARDQALAASRMKSELLAKVSHELRTPLGAILGYTEMMQVELFGPLTSKQIDTTNKIVGSTHYLTDLVSQLLDQAKLDVGRLNLNIRPFNPTKVVEDTLTKLRMNAERKGLTLTAEISADLPDQLTGDAVRLQQILVNLVNNAIKFTLQGQVHIRLYTYDMECWAMRVRDTGLGIPKEAQERIFEAFGQVDGSITRQQSGVGLGLSIVKQFTHLMQGRIELESEVGQGSTFTIILPYKLTQEEELA